MILEYALEPRLLSNWNSFQRLMPLFGITKGRLISRYPKRWAKMVYDAVPSGTTEKSKIEIALKRVERDLLLPRIHSWDDAIDWLANAIAENERVPFQAILASTSSNACSLVIDTTDLDCTDLPELLKAGPSTIITRDAAELGKALRPLLLLAKKVLVVEPNFTPRSPRFREPFSAIVTATLDLQARVRPGVEVELHLGTDKLEEYHDKAAALDSFLSPHVPDGMTITVVAWHKDDVHNRYVITDRGGMQIGEGIGTPDARSTRTTDVLALLNESTTSQLEAQYSDATKHKYVHRVRGTRNLG